MRLHTTFLSLLAFASASQAADQRPQILQSLCNPKDANVEFSPFGFELIQTGESWAAKVYPVSGAVSPVTTIEIPNAKVEFVDSPAPNNFVIALVQSVTINAIELTVIALSEVAGGKPGPFTVTVDTLRSGSNGDKKIHTVEAKCSFVNEETPHDRKEL